MWVLGTGPGLAKIPKEQIPLNRSIGCNRILLTHHPKYVLMVDPGIWLSERERLVACDSMLIASDNIYWPLIRGKYDEASIYAFGFRGSVPVGQMMPDGTIHKGRITGYYAAEIASHMVRPGGRVVLAGMDLSYPSEGPNHVHGDGAADGSSPDPFYDGLRSLVALREALRGEVDFFVAGPSGLLSHGFSPLPA